VAKMIDWDKIEKGTKKRVNKSKQTRKEREERETVCRVERGTLSQPLAQLIVVCEIYPIYLDESL